MSTTTPLTQLEFKRGDHTLAEALARRLGYAQFTYTSTSALIGLFCLPENPEHARGPRRGGCIINTRELGLLFVQTLEDIDDSLYQRELRRRRAAERLARRKTNED
jgi:hypothetical protein